MINIRFLGQFRVTLDGRPVEIPARPAQLLLAWLALHAGQSQPREILADHLWPDSSAANARANLRHALWQLRAAIDPDPAHTPPCILADAHDVTFNCQSDYSLDVEMLTRRPPAWTTDALLAAVEAYQGELLPGFYDPWIVWERERLAAVFDRRMARLLDYLAAEGRWDEALAWAERRIALGDVPEPAYRALMQAYAARGDAGRVMATYQRCRKALQDELGVEPSDETRQLAEHLIRHPHIPPPPAPEGPLWPAGTLAFERQRADLYRAAARRSNRLALGALLGLAAAVGVAVASRRR